MECIEELDHISSNWVTVCWIPSWFLCCVYLLRNVFRHPLVPTMCPWTRHAYIVICWCCRERDINVFLHQLLFMVLEIYTVDSPPVFQLVKKNSSVVTYGYSSSRNVLLLKVCYWKFNFFFLRWSSHPQSSNSSLLVLSDSGRSGSSRITCIFWVILAYSCSVGNSHVNVPFHPLVQSLNVLKQRMQCFRTSVETLGLASVISIASGISMFSGISNSFRSFNVFRDFKQFPEFQRFQNFSYWVFMR
jgi:hypothetical protein